MNKQKGLAPILIVLLIALVIGGYLIYQKQVRPTSVPQQTSESTPVPVSNSESTNSAASPAPNGAGETANWKTYTSTELKLVFKYPESYKSKTTNEPKNSIYFAKDIVYTAGGGQAGSDVLQKGAIISVRLLPTKSLAEKDLRSQYGDDIKINRITVDQKQGTEVMLSNNQADRSIYFQKDNGVLEVSLGVGFANNSLENQKYSLDFDQILSTFKFTQ